MTQRADFNGDGRDDAAALCTYGSDGTAGHVFSGPTGLAAAAWLGYAQ